MHPGGLQMNGKGRMSMNRIEEIRRRHRERKAFGTASKHLREKKMGDFSSPYSTYDERDSEIHGLHPLFRPRQFIVKCILAGALIFSVHMIHESSSQKIAPIKSAVTTALTSEFNFAAVSNWYETTFGKPVAFLPSLDDKKSDQSSNVEQAGGTKQETKKKNQNNFAVPVSGEVTRHFTDESKGVTVQTSRHTSVEAVKDGLVVFIGKKKNIGETVIIQHKDGAESWYGRLTGVNVKVYDFVKKGQKVATVSANKNQKHGSFYFALQQNEKFIDPIQVISFD